MNGSKGFSCNLVLLLFFPSVFPFFANDRNESYTQQVACHSMKLFSKYHLSLTSTTFHMHHVYLFIFSKIKDHNSIHVATSGGVTHYQTFFSKTLGGLCTFLPCFKVYDHKDPNFILVASHVRYDHT